MGCCNNGESNAPVIYGKVLPVSGKYIPPQKCLKMITEVVKEQVAEIEEDISAKIEPRVSSLNDTALASGTVVEAVGVPTYVDDVTAYADFGITKKGWYVFASVKAEKGVKVTAQTTVEGAAGYIAHAGDDHVDVAVRFEVASMSVPVTISWDAEHTETFVFKATDLAVRNLDYRVTFYVYDADPYAKWSYKKTTDATISATKTYYTKTDGEYVKADVTAGEAVPAPYYVAAPAYELTTDANFQEGEDYYIKQGEDYVKANVNAGDPVASNTYYIQTTTYVVTEDDTFQQGTTYYILENNVYVPAEVTAGETIPAGYYVQTPAYALTTDSRFAEGTNYYIKQGDEYVRVNVTVGDPVAADTYYVETTAYVSAEGGIFEDGTTYYTLETNVYVPAEVTVGDAIPAFYEHSKVTIEGLTRNVTYRLNEIVDCPMEFILPEIEDETHGVWFEIRCRHAGAYSMTLTPQSDDVKIATEHTQAETAGINMINLHYTVVDGVKIWRFMNTHSSIPA